MSSAARTADIADSGDTVTLSCERGERGERDGALVIFIDTSELPKDRPLRVCVNETPVFSARPELGDHDFYGVGEYVDELNRARCLFSSGPTRTPKAQEPATFTVAGSPRLIYRV